VTYGENSSQLRAELAALLRQHRIQQRLGGPGGRLPESTTPVQRAELGRLIQSCRQAAMVWCHQAVVAADPAIALPVANEEHSRGPAEELGYRLKRSIELSRAGLPTTEELTVARGFPMVECWRGAAKAAVLGEHDFPGLMDQERLSIPQRMVVLKDAAEVAQAVVVLDTRYKNIPGWIPIRERGHLKRAATACATFAERGDPDYTVDQKGWRPPSATIGGGPLPRIGGVLQAEHNMLVHLAQVPNALNLRRVLNSQRILSHEAARRASNVAAPELVDRWLVREETYKRLSDEMRNVGGLVGNGGLAAAEAANAVGRLRHLKAGELIGAESLQDLEKLFARVDARVAAIIEQGVADKLYFVTVRVPRIIDGTGQLVSPGRQRYLPITSPIQTKLLTITTSRLLGRASTMPVAHPGAHASREELRHSIDHRPERRTGPPR
jgi:hypothetical protein